MSESRDLLGGGGLPAALLLAALAIGCAPQDEPGKAGEAVGPQDELSYFLGYNYGTRLKDSGNEAVDHDALLQGLKAGLAGAEPALSDEQMEAALTRFRARQAEAFAQQEQQEQAMSEENLMEGKEFLADNAKKEGVQVQESGLQLLVLEEGAGASPVAADTVMVHYEGRLLSGEVFDSSRQRGQPAEFGLRQVIPGWTEGLQLMKVGGKARLFIPADLAYGPGGAGKIPPNATLIFDVELLEIK